MKNIFAFWGCGNGPLRMRRAHVRILSGSLFFLAGLSVPLQSAHGVVFLIAMTACWSAYAGLPWSMVFRCALASAILFFPFLLLTPWMTPAHPAAATTADRIAQAGAVALRSTCILFTTVSTIAALGIQDVHRGLARLPVPRPLAALIVQLVNQTMLLMDETGTIISVLRLRGAGGMRGMRVLFSFPVVWMVRMLFRAERCAAAMTIRGYGIERAAPAETSPLTYIDMLTIVCAASAFAAAVLMRTGIIA